VTGTAGAPAAVAVLGRGDPRFPKALLQVQPQPEALYALGDLDLLGRRMVGIVGSRTPTPYGARVAYQAARVAAEAGLVVVSGMARGLDARAHRGALDAGGTTIAVLGSGVDVCYPACNRDLYAAIRRGGLLLSEAPPGRRPHRGAFPRRNRLIAGLAECLLVVEGKARGGTHNTVAWMHTLGKHVLAVPGRIDDAVAEGPNRMIRDGAALYLGPNDLLEPFGLRWTQVVAEERRRAADEIDALLGEAPDLLSAEARIFDLLAADPQPVDVLAERAALEPGTMLAALSSLELKGLAVQLPGKLFALAT
jgi:DNA processing protein